MGILLLLDKNSCPRCRCDSVSSTNCRNCGVRLFTSPFNWHQYEREQGNREWYLWDKTKGWMHRTHILDFDCKEVQELKPLSREVKFDMPDKDYGKKDAYEKIKELGYRIKSRKTKKSSGHTPSLA